MSKGKLISCEGVDAAGKTTQITYIQKLFEDHGYTVIRTREPGGTFVGEALRKIVLAHKMVPLAELLMFNAMRIQHIEEVIKPALERGEIVITDRFHDSSYAYQGNARGQVDEVLELERMVLKGFEPDHTLFFHIPLEISLQRLTNRGEQLDVFEKEIVDFKKKVYDAFMIRVEDTLHRTHVIDATRSIENVSEQVKKWFYQNQFNTK